MVNAIDDSNSARLMNNILWDTSLPVPMTPDTDWDRLQGSDLRFNVVGGAPAKGSDPMWNMGDAPVFTNPTSLDYSLESSSPAIDAGIEFIPPILLDYAGTPREASTPDIGALESPYSAPVQGYVSIDFPSVITEGNPLVLNAYLSDSLQDLVDLGYIPTWQWRLDGIDITGETSQTLTIDPVEEDDAGDYTVVATIEGTDYVSGPSTLEVSTYVEGGGEIIGSIVYAVPRYQWLGWMDVGESQDVYFYVRNNGYDPIAWSASVLSGDLQPAFGLGGPFELESGKSAQVHFRVTPEAVGAFGGEILVSTSLGDITCQYAGNVKLAGTDPPSDYNDVVISEVQSNNVSTQTDEDGDYSTWIELYNRGANAVNLQYWGLSDTPANPFKWQFPDVSLASDTSLIVYASGKDRPSSPDTPAPPELHTNFTLDIDGGYLSLATSNSAGERGPFSMATRYLAQAPDETESFSIYEWNGEPDHLLVQPGHFRFGETPVGTTSSPQVFKLTNYGDTSIRLELDVEAPFAVQSVGLPDSIAPGETLEVEVAFAPTVPGLFESEFVCSVGTRIPLVGRTPTDIIETGSPIYISEVYASKVYGVYGWVEIQNAGVSTIDITDWTLTNDASLPGRWTFPATTLQPGEYLVIHTDKGQATPPLDTSFDLNGDGGYVGLYDHNGTLVHGVIYDSAPRGWSHHYQHDGGAKATTGPTKDVTLKADGNVPNDVAVQITYPAVTNSDETGDDNWIDVPDDLSLPYYGVLAGMRVKLKAIPSGTYTDGTLSYEWSNGSTMISQSPEIEVRVDTYYDLHLICRWNGSIVKSKDLKIVASQIPPVREEVLIIKWGIWSGYKILGARQLAERFSSHAPVDGIPADVLNGFTNDWKNRTILNFAHFGGAVFGRQNAAVHTYLSALACGYLGQSMGRQLMNAHEFTDISRRYYSWTHGGQPHDDLGHWGYFAAGEEESDYYSGIGDTFWNAYLEWIKTGIRGGAVPGALGNANVVDMIRDLHNNEMGFGLANKLSPDLYLSSEVENKVIDLLNRGELYTSRHPWRSHTMPVANVIVPSDDKLSGDQAWEVTWEASRLGEPEPPREQLNFNIPTPLNLPSGYPPYDVHGQIIAF